MSWRTIGTIYAKELRDSLRDRRTLISMIVIPTFVMPALIIGAGKPRLQIVTRRPGRKSRGSWSSAGRIRRESGPSSRRPESSGSSRRPPTGRPSSPTRRSARRWRSLAGFEKALDVRLGARGHPLRLPGGAEVGHGRGRAQRLLHRASEPDDGAGSLRRTGVPASFARPFEVTHTNVAPPEKVGGNLLGGIVPYFIVILCLMGLMYPAMDLTAGEKERGTMETLLCSPVQPNRHRARQVPDGADGFALGGGLVARLAGRIHLPRRDRCRASRARAGSCGDA